MANNKPRKTKSKWTVSVSPQLSERVDLYVLHNQEHVNRSSVVEEALELWLTNQVKEEEEAYYAANAAELNADSKSWSRITTEAAKHIFK
jgi:Arc/MetJ-type ribon-helix-helix transcriptional regulator